MNQEKIGKLIANKRKEKRLTQEELAERLRLRYKKSWSFLKKSMI